MRRERCSHGSACLARWLASSLMLLWLPWMLLWLPWPTQAEQVGSGGHGGKVPHGSLSSPSSSSSSSSSTSPSGSSPWGFSTRQSGGQLDWLLSEKGPFHRCPEYTEFRERFQQGFSTRYKIYRWEGSALASAWGFLVRPFFSVISYNMYRLSLSFVQTNRCDFVFFLPASSFFKNNSFFFICKDFCIYQLFFFYSSVKLLQLAVQMFKLL